MNYCNFVDYRTVLNNQKMNVFDANEAFVKGTIFKTLYIPYKNYLPKQPVSSTEKGRQMLDIQKYFAAEHDLSLYLDVFPNDKNVIDLRNDYIDKYNQALEKYQNKYCTVIRNDESSKRIPYNWSTTPWPWEGNKNV